MDVFISRGTSEEEHFSAAAWDVCCWLGPSVCLRPGLVLLNWLLQSRPLLGSDVNIWAGFSSHLCRGPDGPRHEEPGQAVGHAVRLRRAKHAAVRSKHLYSWLPEELRSADSGHFEQGQVVPAERWVLLRGSVCTVLKQIWWTAELITPIIIKHWTSDWPIQVLEDQ